MKLDIHPALHLSLSHFMCLLSFYIFLCGKMSLFPLFLILFLFFLHPFKDIIADQFLSPVEDCSFYVGFFHSWKES